MPGPLSLRTHLGLLILGAVLPGALLTSIIVRRTLDENRSVLEHRLVIALTGYGQEADAEAAREAGFDARCTKPVTIAVLLNQIASLQGPAAARP